MKKFLAGFLLVFAIADIASASNCLVQLRTWEKNGTPDTVFYPVGQDSIELPQGKRVDIYVQWQSKSASPYLLTASVAHKSGNSVSEKSSDFKNGSVRIETVGLGVSKFGYRINGRSDGKALDIPAGCEGGNFTVNVVPAKKYFDVALAQTATRDLNVAVGSARQMAYNEGSWLQGLLYNLENQVRVVNTTIASSGGDVLLVENDLNVVGSQIADLRLQAPGSASYPLQMQIQRVETLYLRLLQIVAPD